MTETNNALFRKKNIHNVKILLLSLTEPLYKHILHINM